jgi:hypothetical protein
VYFNIWYFGRKIYFGISILFYHLLAQGQTQGSMIQQCTNKTLTTDPFGNTYEADEVSPEVEAGVVVGLKCLQPRWHTDLGLNHSKKHLTDNIHQ